MSVLHCSVDFNKINDVDDDDDDRDATYTSGENSEFCNDAFLHPDVFIHSEP